MRNLLLFVLLLIAIFYIRRALRRTPGRGNGGPGRSEGSAREALQAERMVACAHCGLHVPESESVQADGVHYCSGEHRRLGARP